MTDSESAAAVAAVRCPSENTKKNSVNLRQSLTKVQCLKVVSVTESLKSLSLSKAAM